MAYSLNALTTRPECDVVVQDATEDRGRLTYSLTVAGHSQEVRVSTASDITTDLAVANAQITALETIIPTLPVDAQEERQLEKRKYERERERLLDRQRSSGGRALLARELDVALINAQVTELDAFIAAVQAHKATLPA